MRTLASRLAVAVLAAGLSLGTAGVALAQSAVPDTGSAQGVNPSNSLPGGNTAFGASPPPNSPAAPAAVPPSGAAQGVVNAPAGQETGTVTSSSGAPSMPSAPAGASGTQGSSTR